MALAIMLALLPLLLAIGLRWKYQSQFWQLLISTSLFSLLIVAAFTVYHYGALKTEMAESPDNNPVIFAGVLKNSLVFLMGALFYNGLLAWMLRTRPEKTIL